MYEEQMITKPLIWEKIIWFNQYFPAVMKYKNGNDPYSYVFIPPFWDNKQSSSFSIHIYIYISIYIYIQYVYANIYVPLDPEPQLKYVFLFHRLSLRSFCWKQEIVNFLVTWYMIHVGL
jgi:hypothetical protein